MRYILLAAFLLHSQLAESQTVLGAGHRAMGVAITGTPPAFGNKCTAEQISGSGFTTVACDVTGATGDTIVAFSRNSSGTTFTSYSMTGCTAGGAWATDDTAAQTGGTVATQQGHAYNITSGGTCHVIATYANSTGIKNIWATTLTGARTAGDSLAQHNITALATASTVCGDCVAGTSVTTTENNEYIIGACISSGVANLTIGTGFTVIEADTTRGLTEGRTKIAAGPVAVTCGRSSTSGSIVNVHILTIRSSTPS